MLTVKYLSNIYLLKFSKVIFDTKKDLESLVYDARNFYWTYNSGEFKYSCRWQTKFQFFYAWSILLYGLNRQCLKKFTIESIWDKY